MTAAAIAARKLKKAETAERIRLIARDAFTASGWGHVGAREIAREAGVTMGALFGCWGDMAHLYVAAMQEPVPTTIAFGRVLAFVREVAATPADSESAPTLRRLIHEAQDLDRQLQGNHP
jgi:AcrR family transcriptional regulator